LLFVLLFVNLSPLIELHEVISYMRREKNIIETRLEIAERESQRWRQQASHCLTAKDEAQALLRQEQEHRRQRITTEEDYRAQTEQLKQFNLIRESNITLRNQYERCVRSRDRFESGVRRLNDRVAELNSGQQELTKKLEVIGQEKERVLVKLKKREDRINRLVEKYKSVDPEEHEQLKEDFEILQRNLKGIGERNRTLINQINDLNMTLATNQSGKEFAESERTRIEGMLSLSQVKVRELENEVTLIRENKQDLVYQANTSLNRLRVAKSKYKDQLVTLREKCRKFEAFVTRILKAYPRITVPPSSLETLDVPAITSLVASRPVAPPTSAATVTTTLPETTPMAISEGLTDTDTTHLGTTHLGTTPLRMAPPGTTPSGTTPSGTTPSGTTPSGTTPLGTTPSGTTPSGTTPLGTTPLGTTPLGTTPLGTNTLGTTPLDTTPLGTTPLDTTPLGTTPSGTTLGTALTSTTFTPTTHCSQIGSESCCL